MIASAASLELVRPEGELVGREQLGGGPDAAIERDLEVKVARSVDRDVVRIALADARHAPRRQLPGVALPGDGRRAGGRRPAEGDEGQQAESTAGTQGR